MIRKTALLLFMFVTLVSHRVAVAQPPGNDVCPGYAITYLPYSQGGSTLSATNDYAQCAGPGESRDVVYNLTLACSTLVVVSLCNTNYNTVLDVRTGGACPGSTLVVCNDNYCFLSSQAWFSAAPNQTYFILVQGNGLFDYGNYGLSVTGTILTAPVNDHCEGPQVPLITNLPYAASGNTLCANYDAYGEHCGVAGSPDVFYSVQLAVCTYVTASLCGSGFDTVLDVTQWCSAFVDCSDDFCGSQSQVTFLAVANVRYNLRVRGHGLTDSGPFVLNVTGVPMGGDSCPGIAISSLPFTATGNTYCAVNNYPNCVSPISRDMVYQLTLDSCRTVTATLCGSTYDAALEVRTGGACPGDNLVRCNDDNYCDTTYTLQPTVTWVGLANTTYYLLVSGSFNYTGAYALNVTGTACPVPESVNDLVARPLVPGNDLALDWSPRTSADYYFIYRGDQSSFPLDDAHQIAVEPDTHFVDLNVLADPNVKRFYVVTAVNDVTDYGLSGNLPPKEAAVMSTPDPRLPTSMDSHISISSQSQKVN